MRPTSRLWRYGSASNPEYELDIAPECSVRRRRTTIAVVNLPRIFRLSQTRLTGLAKNEGGVSARRSSAVRTALETKADAADPDVKAMASQALTPALSDAACKMVRRARSVDAEQTEHFADARRQQAVILNAIFCARVRVVFSVVRYRLLHSCRSWRFHHHVRRITFVAPRREQEAGKGRSHVRSQLRPQRQAREPIQGDRDVPGRHAPPAPHAPRPTPASCVYKRDER